ncbi:MAG TPA: allose kinase [Caproiciproducens sp.]|jgi:Transcriptional regulator/sugar kinase|nr:allose kinase [Caproiciproducens sp.]
MKEYAIGIDIGGTNFRIGMVSQDRKVENFRKKSSAILTEGDSVSALAGEIRAYMEEFGVQDKIAAVAIGLPSIVSKDRKFIYSTPNLKGFDNINLADPLSKELGTPVFVDRDVNFLLQNDILQCGLDATKTILGFYIGTGFGNAIYIQGKFYRGKNGVAGELGHTPLYGLDEQCSCGNYGCAEVRCSGKYLEKLTNECFPGTKISEVFVKHKDDPRIIGYVKNLSIPIATEVNILDPDCIIIAGGVVFMEGFPKDILLDALKAHLRKPYPYNNLEILFTEHTQQSGVLGSGDFARRAAENQVDTQKA